MKKTESAVSTPTRVRNRRGEGAKLRDEIIAAAAEILDEEGDERAVTLRSVARRIGIAAPSIYPHFPDQPAIMLAVVRQEFDRLAATLRAAADTGGRDPRQRLLAACHAYLDLARTHPERYRTMFGGLWMPTIGDSSVSEEDLTTLGSETLQIIADELGACVAAGQATSDDLFADAVALWLGLHGLAHQRAVTRSFPWPDDIAERIIGGLAHLEDV
ncbi:MULTISPECIES: TetR/AcrR family transcriptional regulator [unclassified Nocardia]|uniref:TetR/AcrR family transcriptional regulator n=1 Tax=unclassified Nocardia TaxID=2637762 RepID=UPI001CE4442C|nr:MULTISPECIES: TetR/AcrR family transcriptional regulator [unclassified Nocardia]